MPTLEELRAKPHLSVHSLKTFLDCPRKWALKYIDRIEPAFRAVALALGTSLHQASAFVLLEHASGRSASRAEAQAVLRDALAAELHADGPPVLLEDEETEDDLMNQASAMLEALLDDLPKPDRVLGVEVPFSLELFDPDTGDKVALPLVGAIDLVTIEAGRVVYTELKTGKRRWSDDQLAYDLQLTTYGLALRQQGHRSPTPRLLVVTKTKIPGVQLESPHREKQHARDLAALASSVLRAVKVGVDHPVRSWACKTCPFAGACR